MAKMSTLALTSRSATLLLAPNGAKYQLPESCPWTLKTAGSSSNVAQGVTEKTVVFLTDLAPETTYVFSTSSADLEFTTRTCSGLVNIQDFGANSALEDNQTAIQAAIKAVPVGGTLRIPAGRYFSGPLFLKSNLTVLLDKDAVLAAISDWNKLQILPARDDQGRVIGTWEGLPEDSFASLINGIGCSDVTLTGTGIIDGGGDRGDWWSWPKETRRDARRPRTVFFAHSSNIQLSGIQVRNSPSWTIHPFKCQNFNAAAVKIENPPNSPNTDGLNPESCEGVSLTGLHFSVGDDCIAVKAGKRDGYNCDHLAASSDIHISHCLMERGHGAVVLGSEMSGDITDVSIDNCQFVGTDRGLRIKTRRGRGGKVARVSMTNVEMDHVATAVSANAFYFCDADGKSDAVQSRTPGPVDELTPQIKDIRISNVVASNVQLAAVALLGLPEAPLSQIYIENMQVTFDPHAEADVPLMACQVPACRHQGVLAEYAEVIGEINIISKDSHDVD
ncbi:MAG: glycoside hydrolase family 28 protein [Roseibium sp.]